MKKFLLVLLLASSYVTAAVAQKYNGVVDKTAAIIGNEAILLSDIEVGVKQMIYEGLPVDKATRCSVLEAILKRKLFIMQAKVDSLTVNQESVNSIISQRIDHELTLRGGQKGLEDYYGKPLYKLKEEWTAFYQDLGLEQQMDASIRSKVPKLTPMEVKAFVSKKSADELPIVPQKYQISQIVVYPDREEAALVVKERLLELRERIMNGESFSTLARIYSQDRQSAMKGGELGMASKSIFWPSFSDAAMALKEGQVSQIVESPNGYHLIQMIKKEGDMFNARHILLIPQYTTADKQEGFSKLDSIRTEINSGNLAFETAARIYSDDLKTRTNGGQMADASTGSVFFDMENLNPIDYNAIKTLKEGEISEPFESVTDDDSRTTIYKIIRVDKIIPSHVATFEQDYDLLLSHAAQEREDAAIEEFLNSKIDNTLIVIDPIFEGCEFNYDWIK